MVVVVVAAAAAAAAALHEQSEPVVHVAVGLAKRVVGLHADVVEVVQRHGQRLRPEALVDLELLRLLGRGEALLLDG